MQAEVIDLFGLSGLMAQLGVKDFGKNGRTHSKNCVSYVCTYHIALDTTKTAQLMWIFFGASTVVPATRHGSNQPS